MLLLTTLFITKSSGFSISFSSTYFAMRSTKGLPNLIAFPLLTPWHFSSSSKVVGYRVAISWREFSRNTTKGGNFFFLASIWRSSFNCSNSFSSAAAESLFPSFPSSSSALASSNRLLRMILRGFGFLRNSSPFLVILRTPYSSISFLRYPSKRSWRIREFQ